MLGQHGTKSFVHAGDRVANAHRTEGVAVVSAPNRQQPMLLRTAAADQNWIAILMATSTDTES